MSLGAPGAAETPRWSAATVGLRGELAAAVPRELLLELHRPRPFKHFAVLAWQIVLVAGGAAGAALLRPIWLWLPCSVVLGVTFFNFTVLLHEVVHDAVFARRGRARANAFLGWLYAFPSGISKTQFTRWHLDHHANLGDPERDPKRRRLSPKRNARWFKLLYATPALIPLYFRAAALAARDYAPETRRRIARERVVTVVGQLAILATIVALGGWGTALRVYLVPYLFVFPAAFTLNRLGQHYDVDPADPAKWGTRMAPSVFWDVAFLWSSRHLEHHYFPRVPFYNLPRLTRALEPFFRRRGVRSSTYVRLVWQWYVRNRAPHTDWRLPTRPAR